MPQSDRTTHLADQLRAQRDQARRRRLAADGPTISPERAEQLVAALRAGRDGDPPSGPG